MSTLHSSVNPVDRDGLCLLSLDGGGVRGLSSLYILKCIMTLVNSERHGSQILKPCDIFDMIAGTSTGGLIAIMLGRLEMDVDECIKAYRQLMKSIFSEKTNNLPFDWSMNIQAQYDSKKLRAAIDNVVTQAGASPHDLLNDGKTRRCRVFVCAVAKETLHITRLRSYDALEENTPSPTISEAALATSAATGFFDPVRLGDRQFVDGAFGANNPVEEMEEEACDIWCHLTRDLKALTKCLVSIGTGNPAKTAIDDNLVKFLSKTLVRMATKPEGTERRFLARWRNECKQGLCFRFNVEQGLQDVQMSDYQKRSVIEAATQDYLHHPRQQSQMDDCTTNLARKRGKTALDFGIRVQEYKLHNIRIEVQNTMKGSQGNFPFHKPSYWMVPFERNPRYVDRDVVDSLKDMLFSGQETQSVAVCGLGGVGKTQIAMELAHQAREQYPDCSVFWVPAMSPESIQQAYLDIASHLGIGGHEKEIDIKKVVNDHLTQGNAGRWLLIFDNADDLETWKPDSGDSSASVIPRKSLPRHPLGANFFTTRSLKVARYLGLQRIVQIPEMDEKSARLVLKNCLVDKSLLEDRDETAKLLRHLTYLPLAIVQAAAFINQNSISIKDYISLLDGQEEIAVTLLSEEFEDKGRYKSINNPVATTWLTSFAQIQRESTYAIGHLSFMACIDYRNIPISLLCQGDEIEHQKALGILQAYSFIRLRPDNQSLDLHRLVHLAMRIWLRPTMADSMSIVHWETWALFHMARVFPRDFRSDWNMGRAYITHALKLLESTPANQNMGPRMELANLVSWFLQYDGRYKDAEKLISQTVKSAKLHLGAEHPFTLSCIANLASLFFSQGRLKESRDLVTQNLHTQVKVLGIYDICVVSSFGSLATVYSLLGDNNMAEWLNTLAARGLIKFYGLSSIDAISTIHRMVLIYLEQGRISDGIKLGALCLSIAQKALGPDDPSTANVEEILAHVYCKQGQWKHAERIFRQSLDRHKKLWGPENPGVIRIMCCLAQVLSNQGKDMKAISMMTEFAELSAKFIGPHSDDTKTALAFIDYWRNEKPWYDRIVHRLSYTHKSMAIIERRRLYPRVKVCGGLWHVRRQIMDDSFIREVKAAAESHWYPQQTRDGEGPVVEGFEDKCSSGAESFSFDYSAYVSRYHKQDRTAFS